MKLYFSPGACSMASHIVLCEIGKHFDLDLVDLAAKKTVEGQDYYDINPKGYVPALQLEDEQVLTEGPAILQYLADLAPEKNLAPPAGGMARYRLMEMLNFISTELHKTYTPLFRPGLADETRAACLDTLTKRVGVIAAQLEKTPYITGDTFSVADAYLFTVLSWSRHVKFDLDPWPVVNGYLQRIAARPSVHEALLAEGLVKE